MRINQLVKSLLRKDSLEQCSLHELRTFADQNPYFGAAQLLLTKKLQQENAADYESQLQKTYMFFHNPLWVEQLLNDTGNAIIKKATVKTEAAPVSDPPPANSTPLPEVVSPVAVSPVEEVIVPSQPVPEPVAQVSLEAGLVQPESTVAAPQTVAEPPTAISAIELAESVFDTNPPEEITAPVMPEETQNTQPAETVSPIISGDTGQDTGPTQTSITADALELAFEPFHTVDYFASQGIKLKEEEKPKDKFSQQLKSFTDWLKIMKRLPAAEVAARAGIGGETKVEQLAEHSLEEKEIITEAMAEVWEKQGNTAKAIDIYSKLSLLEPAKSPYFAAKIEELKKSN